jgi:hypothetical protein
MPELIESTESVGAATEPPGNEVRRARWTRTHTIWTLIVLSLLPAGVIAMYRGHWLELPAGVKGAVYLISAMLIVGVVGLIISGGDRRSDNS